MSKYRVIDLDADPFIPKKGWTVYKHRKAGRLDPRKDSIWLQLSHVQFNGERDSEFTGHSIRKSLKHEPVLNANALARLRRYPSLINKVGSTGDTIIFWGTIFQDKDNELIVRCLVRRDGRRWTTEDRYLRQQFRKYAYAAFVNISRTR